MKYTRRDFASSLGVFLVSGGSALAQSATSQDERHEHMPMTTHASGSGENRFLAADEIWAKLVAGNKRFVDGKLMVRDTVARRAEVAGGQHPQVVVLGCSDSRVSPTLIFDQGLGDLFEVRTAGNVADALAMGSIEIALEHLPIRVVVILGHEGCGVVAAAASGEKMPTPNLQAVVNKIHPAITKVKGDPKTAEFQRKAVVANVGQCATDLLASSPIILRETAASNVEIIKALYSLKTGEVTRLT